MENEKKIARSLRTFTDSLHDSSKIIGSKPVRKKNKLHIAKIFIDSAGRRDGSFVELDRILYAYVSIY